MKKGQFVFEKTNFANAGFFMGTQTQEIRPVIGEMLFKKQSSTHLIIQDLWTNQLVHNHSVTKNKLSTNKKQWIKLVNEQIEEYKLSLKHLALTPSLKRKVTLEEKQDFSTLSTDELLKALATRLYFYECVVSDARKTCGLN